MTTLNQISLASRIHWPLNRWSVAQMVSLYRCITQGTLKLRRYQLNQILKP